MEHQKELKPLLNNDDELFPDRAFSKPTMMSDGGDKEFFIDHIVDCRETRNKRRYLIRWIGWGPESDSWLSEDELENSEVLKEWRQSKYLDGGSSEGGRV